jgi:hypothetical protein
MSDQHDAAADPPTLQDRLRKLRSDAIRQLAEGDGIDTGLLAIVAHSTAAIAALEEAGDAVAADAWGG